MPGSGRPSVGQADGLIAICLIVALSLVAYSALAPILGWPQLT